MRIWHYDIAFLICSYVSLSAQAAVPLASQYVECVRDEKALDVGSRTVQTPIFVSKAGSRAFGKVLAKAERGCENTSTIYVSQHHRPFRVAFQQKTEVESDGTTLDGNGVKALLWSPSGAHLLVEISQWVWGSDAGTTTKYLLYRGAKPVKVVKPLDAVWNVFNKPCSALVDSVGWIDDSRIELTGKPFVSTDEDGIPDKTPPCLKKPMRFSFDVETGKLEQLRTRRKNN
ncbi:MAG: hypothetical protein M3O09_10820 [Acidobacteriota bacterium]|nr:hypothetical protein [Acidobacteriota bacterium]